MVDLNAAFDNASPIVRQAIETAGSSVAVLTGDEPGVDPHTLAETGDPLAPGTAAKVYLTDYSLSEGQPLPGVELMLGDWKVLALPEFAAPDLSLLQCVTSRESTYVGRRARVLGSKHGGHGMMVTVYARPIAP